MAIRLNKAAPRPICPIWFASVSSFFSNAVSSLWHSYIAEIVGKTGLLFMHLLIFVSCYAGSKKEGDTVCLSWNIFPSRDCLYSSCFYLQRNLHQQACKALSSRFIWNWVPLSDTSKSWGSKWIPQAVCWISQRSKDLPLLWIAAHCCD